MSINPPIAARDDIDDFTARFRIDDALRTLWNDGELTEHWNSEARVVGFGRFALDKSIHMAIGAGEKLELRDVADDWKEIAERAAKASDALTEFISWVAGPAYFAAPSTAFHRRPNSPSWKARTLEPAFRKFAALEGHPIEYGQSSAETIAAAHEVLTEFSAFAKANEGKIRSRSKNPGDPILAEFILRMAETWFLLTGKVPGSSARPENNPFLRFAIVAWEDAGGDPPVGATFAQSALGEAIATLGASIAANASYVPPWARV